MLAERRADRLAHARSVLAGDPAIRFELAQDNDALLAACPPGTLVVNATGLGKDAPGSPLRAPIFPAAAIAWDLNDRGDLLLLDQARGAGITAVDGWRYFPHGWLADAGRMCWSSELASALGVELRVLPPIRPADAVIGKVTPAAAALTGLPAGLPIACGAGDFPTALLGSGVAGPGAGSDVTGTSTLIAVHGAQPLAAPGIMNLHAAGPGWIGFTMIDAGGDAVRWARRALAVDSIGFAELEALAATAPTGAEGLLFSPFLNSDRLLGAEVRAGFHGLSARHGRPHLLRAVLEGTALASAANLERMRAAGAVIERIVASGGGAKGLLWPAIKASVWGVPVLVPENPESALLGAAILAGAGTGLSPDRAEAIRRCVRYAREILPDPAAQALYRERAALFDALFRATLPLQARLAAAG